MKNKMIKHYNFIIEGKLISVTATSLAEAEDKANEEHYLLKNSTEDGD